MCAQTWRRARAAAGAVALLAPAATAAGGLITVNYAFDAESGDLAPPGALSASAAFSADGTQLTIVVTNTSAGSFGGEVSDSLLVSLGFDLPAGVFIVSGDGAVIADGASGLGAWSDLGPGDSVAEQWIWTSDFGGDFLEGFRQVISTSQGQGGGDKTSFTGDTHPNVSGPFGGIAADPPLVAVPDSQPAVRGAIEFTLTLSDPLTAGELQTVASGSVVEFGSDFRYLAVPTPGGTPLLVLALILGLPRRRPRRA